jgi:SAM-dependent methyltransferase
MPFARRMELSYEVVPCPACGANDDDEIASREAISREMEELWEFHLARLRPGTPRRFLTDRIVFSQAPPLRIGRCSRCGTLYRNPVERGRDLLELYAEEPLDAGVMQGLFDAQRATYRAQAQRLARLGGGRGVALEVGSYVGAFQAAAAEVGWQVEGVDLNRQAVEFARDAGYRVRVGQISDADAEGRFDAVTIWNCFDQLPEPRVAVREASLRLRAGGVLAIRVPSGDYYARMRRRLSGPLARPARAALAHNNLLGFPYRTGYTAHSLSRLLEGEGFQVVAVIGDTLVPIADRWTRPWARWEERVVKHFLRLARRGASAPWLEVYARSGSEGGREK